MKASYFTFGQGHVHTVNGKVFDKDCVVKIIAECPRDEMFKVFGRKWCFEYDEDNPPTMEFYPRGIIKLE